MNKTVLVMGHQTSLGKAYRDNRVGTEGVDGDPEKSWDELLACSNADRILICHGKNHLSKIGTTEEDWGLLLHNVWQPYSFINALVKRGQPKHVVIIVSQTYRIPQRCTSLYCASKAALAHMIKVMARELAPSGWIINGLAPGKIVDTRMAEMTDKQVNELRGWTQEEADKYALSNVPMGRFTDTKEVCQGIDWLFEAPSYINGTVVDMTGGV